jgi:dTDP-4-amino-4,6-dideoxygalactose transaminase
VEDCAHTMAAKWNGKFTGTFGAVGCFSTQTFKHINSGEGGIIVTDDEDVAARAILSSGCYMLYKQHSCSPPAAIFDKYKAVTPNLSMRMSNLVACVLRPQLREMDARAVIWNTLYVSLTQKFNSIEGITVPSREPEEQFVASSIQFHVTGLDAQQLQVFSDQCTSRGVAIKWFGREEPAGYTSQYNHWEYLEMQHLPITTGILTTTCDMRIPLTLTEDHCCTIADIMSEEMTSLRNPMLVVN